MLKDLLEQTRSYRQFHQDLPVPEDTLRELVPSLGYLEEQSLVVQVSLGDDNYWSLNDDDFNNLDWLIIDYNF